MYSKMEDDTVKYRLEYNDNQMSFLDTFNTEKKLNDIFWFSFHHLLTHEISKGEDIWCETLLDYELSLLLTVFFCCRNQLIS